MIGCGCRGQGILGFVAVLLAPTWQWMLAALCVLQFPYALIGPSFGLSSLRIPPQKIAAKSTASQTPSSRSQGLSAHPWVGFWQGVMASNSCCWSLEFFMRWQRSSASGGARDFGPPDQPESPGWDGRGGWGGDLDLCDRRRAGYSPSGRTSAAVSRTGRITVASILGSYSRCMMHPHLRHGG